MTPDQAVCVLDTNMFISAFKMFYRPILCPSFWDVLRDLHMRGCHGSDAFRWSGQAHLTKRIARMPVLPVRGRTYSSQRSSNEAA